MHVHLEPTDPDAIAYRDQFHPGMDLLSVQIDGTMRRGHCYANVTDTIADKGGSMQLCWLIAAVPGRFIEATHHALWRDATGRLHDVTEHAFEGMTNQASTVILDIVTPPPVDYWHPVLEPQFLVLQPSPPTTEYMAATRAMMLARRDFAKRARREGASIERKANGQIEVSYFDEISPKLQKAANRTRHAEQAQLQARRHLETPYAASSTASDRIA